MKRIKKKRKIKRKYTHAHALTDKYKQRVRGTKGRISKIRKNLRK